MDRTDKYIKRYCLEIVKFEKINLNTLYSQYRPDVELEDLKIINSPHLELADLYYKNGFLWLEKNFNRTKYYIFKKNILRIVPHITMRKIRLFESLKKGYLSKGHEKDYIVVLNDPFICTRYGLKNISMLSPEIIIGHHRAGALIALGINKVKVIIARDTKPGSCQCLGKINEIYIKHIQGKV